MKKSLIIVISLFSCILTTNAQRSNTENIITKNNGRIILAYKVFEDFLKTDKSWETYEKMVLGAYPELKVAHEKAILWGGIDSVTFPLKVTNFVTEEWQKYFSEYNRKTLDYLYDSLLKKADGILNPVIHKPVDLCLFLPYSGCFIVTGSERNTIYISFLIDPADVNKIMVHEYSHNLHFQRRHDEPFSFKREIVSEGMAVYITSLVIKGNHLSESIPFMPESSVKWCIDNEELIKSSMRPELNDTTFNCLKKFIADGPMSTPPKEFVEKTGYFAGYRIIDACIKKGMKLEDVCSMKSDSVIKKSGYFN